MAIPPTRAGRPDADHPRAQPPIRWPRPDRAGLGLLGVWAVGLVVALLLPAAVVPPGAETAPTGKVALAFGCTLIGAAIMIGAATMLWRRSKDAAVMLLGLVPGISCVAGGIILAASKIGGP